MSGLAAGVAMLALAVAAYAIGYHRGEHHARNAAHAPTSTTETTRQQTPTTTAAATSVPVTAALVSRGKQLYTTDSCTGCHSISGAPGAGPSFKGLAGSTVSLDNGKTVKADDAYLERSITTPDADVVKGYHAGIMAPAISGFGLGSKPGDVRALVAFIKSQK